MIHPATATATVSIEFKIWIEKIWNKKIGHVTNISLKGLSGWKFQHSRNFLAKTVHEAPRDAIFDSVKYQKPLPVLLEKLVEPI